jgi:hypothetical protein
LQLVKRRDKLVQKTSPTRQHEGTAYLVFHDPNKADEALYKCTQRLWQVHTASPPDTIIWENFGRFRLVRMVLTLALFIVAWIFSIFFSIPVAFLSSLSSFADIPGIGMSYASYWLLLSIDLDLDLDLD